MAGEYIMRKSDSTSNPPTQKIPPGYWYQLEVENKRTITPKRTSKYGAYWAVYLNVFSPQRGGPSSMSVRWTRNPDGPSGVGAVYDFTGEREIPLNVGYTTKFSAVWVFKARAGQPVAVEVAHNGKVPITIRTRESKLSYEESA